MCGSSVQCVPVGTESSIVIEISSRVTLNVSVSNQVICPVVSAMNALEAEERAMKFQLLKVHK